MRFGRALELPVLVYIGLRSYSIYLWHWPVFVLTRTGEDIGLGPVPVFVIRIVITLILADPGPMFRLGLRVLLREYDEFEIQEAGDLATLLALAGRARAPATALIDLDLPPAGGAAAVTSVRDSVTAPVVWCSGSRLTPDVVYELVRCGAVGILRKEIAPSGIVRTLRAAANGEAPLPRDLVAGLLTRIHSLNAPRATRPPIATLSSRGFCPHWENSRSSPPNGTCRTCSTSSRSTAARMLPRASARR